MKIPGNISYFFKRKQNNSLPDYFNRFILNKNLVPDSFYLSEIYRSNLLKSDKKLIFLDSGAGSKILKSNDRKISEIASVSGTNKTYGLVFHKIVKHFQLSEMLELGTSLGIGTNYFARASEELKITTIEACNQTYLFVLKNLKLFGATNKIEFINNDFDTVLDSGLLNNKKFDLIFIDGNHKGEKLLKYYDLIEKHYSKPQHIIIIDDINWSTDMYRAWKQITKSGNSKTYLNLFRTAIVFSGYDLPAGNFTINFVNNKYF